MTARLFSTQDVTAPRARLIPMGENMPPRVVVDLTDLTYMAISTAAEAYALRDAFGKAGDLLAGTGAPPAVHRTLGREEEGER